MKLSFLGVTYESQVNSIETVETNMQGRFMGRSYTLRRPVQNLENKRVGARKYRGVTY